MNAEASEGGKGRALRVPSEGSLLHIAPEELVGRLLEQGFTGRCLFYAGTLEGEVGLVEGSIVDARALGDFGEAALFRMLGAAHGSYRLDRRSSESAPPQSFGPWGELRVRFREHREKLARAAEAVGGLEQVWSVRPTVLQRHLGDLPDQINPLLRRVDGRRTVAQVITETPLEEPLTVRALARLLSLGVLALPDVVADESGPSRSPLSTTLTPEAAEEESEPVPVIGSDLPVRRDWFEDEQRPQAEADDELEPAEVAESVEPRVAASEPAEEPREDALLPSSDPDGEPLEDPSHDTLRPLPPPPDLVEAAAQEGPPSGVSVTTWSSQGDPPPLFEQITSDDDREEIDRWLGEERAFFATPPLEVEPEEPRDKSLDIPREPALWQKLLAAAAFVLVGALVGYLVGQGCSAEPASVAREAIAD